MLEEIGRNLTPSPFLTTAVVARGRSRARRMAIAGIRASLAGEAVLALAVDEGPRHAPERTALKPKRQGNGFVLNGAKQFVVHGGVGRHDRHRRAHRRRAGRARWHDAVRRAQGRGGLRSTTSPWLDSSKAARLAFDDVAVDADAVVGEVDGGWAPLSRALNAGRAGAAAELVGVAAGASAMTLDYLKQRKQFGKLIGEFQALQHRAAHLYGEIEIARAAALKAAQLLDSGDERAELFVVGRQGQGRRRRPRSRSRKASRCTAGSG